MVTPTPTSPGVAPRPQPVCAISPPALSPHESPRLSIIRPRPAFLSSSIYRETISVRSRPPMRHCSRRRAAARSDCSPRSPGCVRCTSASPRYSKRAACCSSLSTSTQCRPQRLSTSSVLRKIRACSVRTLSATALTSRGARCGFWSSTAFRGRARTFCTGPASPSSVGPNIPTRSRGCGCGRPMAGSCAAPTIAAFLSSSIVRCRHVCYRRFRAGLPSRVSRWSPRSTRRRSFSAQRIRLDRRARVLVCQVAKPERTDRYARPPPRADLHDGHRVGGRPQPARFRTARICRNRRPFADFPRIRPRRLTRAFQRLQRVDQPRKRARRDLEGDQGRAAAKAARDRLCNRLRSGRYRRRSDAGRTAHPRITAPPARHRAAHRCRHRARRQGTVSVAVGTFSRSGLVLRDFGSAYLRERVLDCCLHFRRLGRQRVAQPAQLAAQAIDLVEQAEHHRQCLIVDREFVTDFEDQLDPGDVHLVKQPSFAVSLGQHPAVIDPAGELAPVEHLETVEQLLESHHDERIPCRGSNGCCRAQSSRNFASSVSALCPITTFKVTYWSPAPRGL